MARSIETHHNPFEEAHSERTSWVKEKGSGAKSVIYFAGCTASYREQSIAESTASILSETLGYDVIVSDEEWCCGSPLLRTGHYELALEIARHNVDLLNSVDAESIIVSCPGCLRVLTQDYPEHGLKLNKPVFHISQILQERIDTLPSGAVDGTATYHDPCHLGRHCGIYDPPRDVVERLMGGGLVEMEHNRDDAMCCGNGAGLRTLFPDKAREIGTERVEQAIRTDADFLITACPFCKNLLDAQSLERIEVIDLPELVKRAGQQEGQE
jgi:heterodisulfide reductase subunit D